MTLGGAAQVDSSSVWEELMFARLNQSRDSTGLVGSSQNLCFLDSCRDIGFEEVVECMVSLGSLINLYSFLLRTRNSCPGPLI
jgi:hypothetical protein